MYIYIYVYVYIDMGRNVSIYIYIYIGGHIGRLRSAAGTSEGKGPPRRRLPKAFEAQHPARRNRGKFVILTYDFIWL